MNTMKLNKKAEITFMMLIIWAILLVIVFISIVYFTSGFVSKELDVRDAEARIFANRIIYSPTGISYFDEDLGRNIPGTVDLRKVDSSWLENSVYSEDNQILAARISITPARESAIYAKEALYNQDWYLRWLPLVGKIGSGGSTELIETRYVNVYDGKNYRGPAMLEIQVLIPNA